jgi:hypothetical protein
MAQENPYLIEENPYLKKEEENPYLNIAPKPQQPIRAAAPTLTPSKDEPTAAELEAASKPAFMTKQQVMGNAAPALEAIRPKEKDAAPSLTATQPAKPRDFSALDEEIAKATPNKRPMLLPADSRKTRQMVAPSLTNPQVPEDSFTPEKAAKLPNTVQLMSEYLQIRQPNKQHAKDPVGIAKEFRSSFVRGDFATVDELTWALNATPAQKEVAAKAYEISDKLGTPIMEEVRAVINPLESPTTYLSGIVGMAAKQTAVHGVKTGLRMSMKPSTQIAAVEGALGTAQNLVQQKTKVEIGIKDEISYAELALSAGLSAIVGKVTSLPLDTAKTGIFEPTAQRMEKLVAEKGKTLDEISDLDKQWLDQYAKREKEVVAGIREETPALFESTDVKRGIREGTLDKISAQTDTTKAILNDQTLTDIYKVTKELFKANPELRPNLKETKITQGIVDALSQAGPDDIQAAAARAGVTPADFLETFKVSLSDAGQVLQQASQMSKFVQNLSNADPELEKVVNRLYNKTGGIQYWSDKIMQPVASATGLSVAAAVLAPATSVVNAFSAAYMVALKTAGDVVEKGIVGPIAKGLGAASKKITGKESGVTIEQAADLLDDTVVNVGRMTNDAGGFTVPLVRDRSPTNMADVVADSFFLTKSMMDAGWTGEMADQLLKDHPRLNNMLTHIGAESEERGASKIMNNLQALNIAVDAMVRKPVFIDSVRNRMKDIGLDYEEFVANKRPIPLSIAQKAADDAMKATMTYTFKSKQQLGESGFEASAEHGAYLIQNAIKTNVYLKAGSDLALPFSRFMLNAVRQSYRMTFVSGIGAAMEQVQISKLRKEGKVLEAASMSYDTRRKFIDSAIGTAAIGAIMATRDGTLQTAQYRDQDGNIRDGSPLSPVVQLMVLADVGDLMKDMSKQFWYTLTMTPKERLDEAKKFQEEALTLDKNDPRRQDLLDQYELMGLGRFRNINGAKTMEVLTGMGRQSAFQDTIIDKVVAITEEGLSSTKLKDVAYSMGQAASRFDNVLNPFYEFINAIRGDMRVVESKGSTAMEPVIGELGQSFVAPIASAIPGLKEMYSDKPRPLDASKEPDRLPLVTRQVLGIRPSLPTTSTENEVNRLGIELFRVYKSSGNRDFDALHINESKGLIDTLLTEKFKQSNYAKESMNTQQQDTKEVIAQAFEIMKPVADAKYMGKDMDKAVDIAYSKMPKGVKNSAVDKFVKRNEGRSPSTVTDKLAILQGAYKFAKGGLASRRQ